MYCTALWTAFTNFATSINDNNKQRAHPGPGQQDQRSPPRFLHQQAPLRNHTHRPPLPLLCSVEHVLLPRLQCHPITRTAHHYHCSALLNTLYCHVIIQRHLVTRTTATATPLPSTATALPLTLPLTHCHCHCHTSHCHCHC
jgi:hypothetical protein